MKPVGRSVIHEGWELATSSAGDLRIALESGRHHEHHTPSSLYTQHDPIRQTEDEYAPHDHCLLDSGHGNPESLLFALRELAQPHPEFFDRRFEGAPFGGGDVLEEYRSTKVASVCDESAHQLKISQRFNHNGASPTVDSNPVLMKLASRERHANESSQLQETARARSYFLRSHRFRTAR